MLTLVFWVPGATWNELYNIGNATFTTPANGSLGGANDFVAQRFRVNQNCNMSQLKLYIKKAGAPADDFDIEIQTDAAGEPSGTPVTNGTTSIAVGDIGVAYAWETATFAIDPALTASTDYWIVMKSPAGANGDYFIDYDNGNSLYTTGAVAITADGGTTWPINDNTDTSGFKIYINKFSEAGIFDHPTAGTMLTHDVFTGKTKDDTIEYQITGVGNYDVETNY